MEQQKTKSINYILIFFISYSFYIIHFLTQYLFNKFSKQAVLVSCILCALMPLITILICKKINNHYPSSAKNSFISSFFSSIYLLLSTICILIYIISLINIYYYQQSSFVTIILFLSLPVIYTILKGENILFYLSAFLLLAFIFFKYIYISNTTNLDTYPLFGIININKSNILPIIIISLPIVLEPVLLLNSKSQINNKINIKFITFFSVIISLISILTILRQTVEYGNLLNTIRFPYLESIKNIITGSFLENIDNYYLISATIATYTRLTYTLITIKNNFSLSKMHTLIILFIILLITYISLTNIKIYKTFINEILIITSTSLFILFISSMFLTKRRLKND